MTNLYKVTCVKPGTNWVTRKITVEANTILDALEYFISEEGIGESEMDSVSRVSEVDFKVK